MQYSWDALQPLRRTLPRLDAIFCQYNRLLAASARAAAAGEGLAEAEQARRAYAGSMEAEVTAALLDAGLSPEDYRPHYHCPLCRDKGYTLAADGRRVRCVCRAVQHADKANGGAALCTFAEFDESVFPAGPQRETACRHRDSLRRYADVFPKTDKQNFLLLGPTGLGKSFLLSCVASALRDRRVPMRFVTAYQLNCDFRAQHFGGQDALSVLIRVPFLAVDDLGTEPMLRNITIEYLNTLVEERLRRGRHTGVSTNLTPGQLSERYGERIASRLLSPALCDVLGFQGKDLRLLPRR